MKEVICLRESVSQLKQKVEFLLWYTDRGDSDDSSVVEQWHHVRCCVIRGRLHVTGLTVVALTTPAHTHTHTHTTAMIHTCFNHLTFTFTNTPLTHVPVTDPLTVTDRGTVMNLGSSQPMLYAVQVTKSDNVAVSQFIIHSVHDCTLCLIIHSAHDCTLCLKQLHYVAQYNFNPHPHLGNFWQICC